MRAICTTAIAILCLLSCFHDVYGLDNGLAITPPMVSSSRAIYILPLPHSMDDGTHEAATSLADSRDGTPGTLSTKKSRRRWCGTVQRY